MPILRNSPSKVFACRTVINTHIHFTFIIWYFYYYNDCNKVKNKADDDAVPY